MIFALGLIAGLLSAQSGSDFQEIKVAPVFGEGRLLGCAINFKAVQRDVVNRPEGVVGFDGSANVYHFGQGKLGFALKATILDGATREMSRPSVTYLINGLDTNNADLALSEPAENAGYTMSMYRFGVATMDMLTATTGDATFSIGILPLGGTMAHQIIFYLDADQMSEWGGCYQRVLEDALAATENK